MKMEPKVQVKSFKIENVIAICAYKKLQALEIIVIKLFFLTELTSVPH
jgi:hypothetical protein